MPKLNLTTAKRIKVASGEVLSLKGVGFDWAGGSPPAPSYATFVQGTANGSLSNGARTWTRASGSATANTLTDVALHEDCYLEFMTTGLTDDAGPSFYAGTLAANALSTNDVLGFIWGIPALTAYRHPWNTRWWAYYGLAAQDNGNLVTYGSSQATVPQNIQVAYKHSTREMWLRVRTAGVTYPWPNSGDPETGANPTFVFPAGESIKAGASVDGGACTILTPDEFESTAPAGFILGLRTLP